MNITNAVFKPGSKRVTAEPLAQYDYGQTLVIAGLPLPSSFEAHFSNSQFDGGAKPQVGSNSQVAIPDEYLVSGEPIYVFIVLHQSEQDGETEYRITVPVEKRPRPTHQKLTQIQQSEAEQILAALESGVREAQGYAGQAEDALEALQNTFVEATTLEPESEATAEKIVDPETGEVTIRFGIPEGVKGGKGDKGDKGDRGVTGAVFTPNITIDGYLCWTNNGDLPNPEPVDMVSTIINALPLIDGVKF